MSRPSRNRSFDHRLICACLGLLACALGPHLSDAAAGEAGASVRAGGIRGEVIDDEGRPLAGVCVVAWTEAAGRLRDAASLRAFSDPGGRFELPLPPVAVRYTLWLTRGGYASRTVSALSGSPEELEVTLEPAAEPARTLAGKVVDLPSGRPVAGAAVHLSASSGYLREARTDGDGRFIFESLPRLSSAILRARKDERASSYRVLKDGERSIELGLGPPSRLEGVVRNRVSGEPVAGAEVSLGPGFVSDFKLEAKADAEGRYAFEMVPPGKYQAGASAPGFFEPATRGDFLERAELPLAPGQRGFYPVDLLPFVRVAGRVMGPDGEPVADAAVGSPDCWETGGSGGQRWSLARTDGQGRFSLEVGRAGREVDLSIYSPAAGTAHTRIAPLEAGETRDVGAVRLPGTARIRGRVTDSSGSPLADVRVDCLGAAAESAVTSADGRFDLGWFSRGAAESGDLLLRLLAPRPASGPRGDSLRSLVVSGTAAQEASADGPLHLHRTIPLAARAGEVEEVEAALEATERLVFTGEIRDSGGTPVEGARVLLFAGDADERTWQRELEPMSFLISSSSVEHRDVVLGQSVSDADGRWEIAAARETRESLEVQHPQVRSDGRTYSLGVRSPAGETALVKSLAPAEGISRSHHELRLEGATARRRLAGRVVDADGNPLGGIELHAGYVFDLQRVVTADDGRFVFESRAEASRRDERAVVRIDAAGWYVLSPDPGRRRSEFAAAWSEDAGDEIQVVLGRGGVVTGHVRWGSGRPVVGFRISWPGGEAISFDPEGRFRLEGFPPGGHDIQVRSEEGVKTARRIDLEPGGSLEEEILLPDADRVLRGRLLDEQDRPARRITVSISGEHLETARLPDAEGWFQCQLPPGEYTLTPFQADSRHGGPSYRPVRIAIGEEQPDLEVTVRASRAR
ncbi:MAG: carboxypeptidase regulatory-like domain-containing protein [Planctomycetes bacterium]|nr:carboxypeptidase regulatory-like domain-containing protein [Planctomycetota bacterium]